VRKFRALAEGIVASGEQDRLLGTVDKLASLEADGLTGLTFTVDAALLPESLPVLNNAIATLKRYPEVNVEVAGHTDSRGSDAFNLDLSARRAESVLKYLQDGGVSNTMTSRGYGERQPLASNNTDDGRQQNRRVVLRVLN